MEHFLNEAMIAYKEYLIAKYAAASVNSMLTSVNVFLKEMNWHDSVFINNNRKL